MTWPSPKMSLMYRKVKASMPTGVAPVLSWKLQSTEDKASSDSDDELPLYEGIDQEDFLGI